MSLSDEERPALDEALAYARTYWQHGQEPRSQWALTVLAQYTAKMRDS